MPGNIFHFVYSEGASEKSEDNKEKVDSSVKSINTINTKVDFFDYHWKTRYDVEKSTNLLSKMIKYLQDETFMDIID
jgi:hypothetical protein